MSGITEEVGARGYGVPNAQTRQEKELSPFDLEVLLPVHNEGASIERTLRAGGLRIERGCYFYAALLPLVAAQRICGNVLHGRNFAPRSGMREYGAFLNTLLWTICRLELPVFAANRVASLTAFVRASKA